MFAALAIDRLPAAVQQQLQFHQQKEKEEREMADLTEAYRASLVNGGVWGCIVASASKLVAKCNLPVAWYKLQNTELPSVLVLDVSTWMTDFRLAKRVVDSHRFHVCIPYAVVARLDELKSKGEYAQKRHAQKVISYIHGAMKASTRPFDLTIQQSCDFYRSAHHGCTCDERTLDCARFWAQVDRTLLIADRWPTDQFGSDFPTMPIHMFLQWLDMVPNPR